MSREVHVQFCERVGVQLPCATHLVILCNPGEGEGLKERLDRWTRCGLVLNERKTRVIQSRESGFEFLGFAFRWQQSKKGSLYAHVEPRFASRLGQKRSELPLRTRGTEFPRNARTARLRACF